MAHYQHGTASQSRYDGPVMAVENGNVGATLRHIGTKPAWYNVAPSVYCCPGGSQQSKLLYNLLSNRPKDGGGESQQNNGCMPIIEHPMVGQQQVVYNNGNGDANNDTMSNPPPFKFDFKGQMFDAGPYCRQRSQSMGSNATWNVVDVSRTSSHDSLASHDSVSEENRSPSQQQSEALLEVTRRKLMNLIMEHTAAAAPHADGLDEDMRSLSQPGSPPSSRPYPDVPRKYSEGSQRVHLKAKLQSARARYESHLPVDLSCKRKRLLGIRVPPKQLLIEGLQGSDVLPPDEGIDPEDHSILKSVLTGRGRSNSLSVFELRRLRMAGRAGQPNQNASDGIGIGFPGRFNGRQRVTLAKKNLLPVIARISDRLNKIMEFAKSLPEFMQLPLADRKVLLANACPRLLLLYMAEGNLQFAVTPVSDNSCAAPAVVHPDWEAPTMPFVDSVQNFIRKCQTINISANEYFYMRMITLFHTGAGSLERPDLADVVNSEARQDLQDFVQHSSPTEKLRYSNLLLSLHTLFGIHCGMLQTLFCQHLAESGGVGACISEALNAET